MILTTKCTTVEKNTNRFITTCYNLQGTMEDYKIRKELSYLANYIEKVTPKCSAADFFIVNRNIIGPIFSVVATYLIIIVQFYMSEKTFDVI